MLVLVSAAGFAIGGIADERWTNAFLRDLAERSEKAEVIDFSTALHFADYFTFRHGALYVFMLLVAATVGVIYLLLRQQPKRGNSGAQQHWSWFPTWLTTATVVAVSAFAGALMNRLLTAREFSQSMSQFSKDAVLDPWHAQTAAYYDVSLAVGVGLLLVWGSWLTARLLALRLRGRSS